MIKIITLDDYLDDSKPNKPRVMEKFMKQVTIRQCRRSSY